MADETVSQIIWKITVQGVQESERQLQTVVDKLNEATAAKDKLNQTKLEAIASGASKKVIDDITESITEQEKEISELKVTISSLSKELSLLIDFQKKLNTTTDDSNKKSKETQATIDEETKKTKTLTQQINELRAARQQAIKDKSNVVIVGDQDPLTMSQANRLEQDLLTIRNKSLEIVNATTGALDKEQIAIKGSLTLYEQEFNLLNQILKNRGEFTGTVETTGGQKKSYDEIIARVQELNNLIDGEKLRIKEINEGISTELSLYRQSVEARKALAEQIKAAEFAKSDEVQFGKTTISIQQAHEVLEKMIAKENQLNQSLTVQQNILKELVGSRQLILLSEDKLLTAQQKELAELKAIQNLNINQSTVVLKDKVLTYEQLTQRIAELEAAENAQITTENNLRTGIESTSKSIENLTDKQQRLATVIAQLSAPITRVSGAVTSTRPAGETGPVSVSRPFEGQNVTLKEAEALQSQITHDLKDQNSQLNLLNQEQAALNIKKQQEHDIAVAALVADAKSLEVLQRRSNELESLLKKRDPKSTVLIDFEGNKLSFDMAERELKKINADLEVAITRAKSWDFSQPISEAKRLKAEIDDLSNRILIAKSKGGLVELASGLRVPMDVALGKLTELNVLQNNNNKLLDVSKTIIDAKNAAQDGSITKLREERIQLEEILRNRQLGATSVSVGGVTTSVTDVTTKVAQNTRLEEEWKDQIKARNLAMAAANEGLAAMEAKVGLLTLSLRQLNGQLTSEQWSEMKVNLAGIVPELQEMTLADANAGKAQEILVTTTANASTELKEFRRSISGAGTIVGDYTKGIVAAFRQLNLGGLLQKEKNDVDNEINQIVANINKLNIAWRRAVTEGFSTEKIENELKSLGLQFVKLSEQSRQMGQALSQTGGIATQVTRAIGEGFKGLDKQITQTLFTYLGFQAAVSSITQVIRIDRQVSDQFADLQRVLGATKEQIDGVVNSIRELNTRTSLPDLFNFALIAARAGVATENIAGVTAAIDRLHVVAGDSIGDIEHATTNIVKLINVFEGAGHVTEDSVTRIGNALIQLESSGVATTEFLINFADRMAGVEGISKIGIKSVLGLGAAFEETGATAEVSASAITQILLRINSDIAKYAGLAKGITDPLKVSKEQIESFRTLVRENPGQALIQLATGLRGNKQFLDEFAESLGGLSARGVRITSVFGLLGANADYFTRRIKNAGDAIDGQAGIIDSYVLKQETLASTLDKISKQFQLAFSSKEALNALSNIGNAVLLFVRALTSIPFAAVITLLGTFAAAWAYYRGQVIATTLVENLQNRSTLLGNVARTAAKLGLIENSLLIGKNTEEKIANLVATEGLTVAEAEMAVATDAANAAFAVSPLGAILAVVALAIPLMAALADSMKHVADQANILRSNVGEAQQKFTNLKNEFVKNREAADELLPRYKTLKAELSELQKGTDAYANKQIQLDESISDIGKAFPIAITAFGDYGQAIDISTQKLEKFLGIQEEVLRKTTTQTIASSELLILQLQEEDKALAKSAELALQGRLRVRKEKETFVTGPSGELIKTSVPVEQAATDQDNLDAINKHQANLTEQKALQGNVDDLMNQLVDGFVSEGKLVGDGAKQKKLTLDEWKQQLKLVTDEIADIDAFDTKTDLQKKRLEALRDKKSDIERIIKELGGETTKVSTTNIRFEKDELSEIEAIRARELAIENNRFANLHAIDQKILDDRKINLKSYQEINRQNSEITLSEQVTHLKNLQAINNEFDTARINRLTQINIRTQQLFAVASGSEAERLRSQLLQQEKDIAETENKIAERRVATQKQIQSALEKEFREDTVTEKKALEARIAELNTTFEAISRIEGTPAIIIAEAQRQLHNKIFQETAESYNRLIIEGKAFGIDVQNLQEDQNKKLQEAIKQGLDDNNKIYQAYFDTVEQNFATSTALVIDRINTLREQVLNANLPPARTQALLDVSDQIQAARVATETLKKESVIYAQKLIDFNLGTNKVTEEQLAQFHANVVKAKEDVTSATDALNENINKFDTAQNAVTSVIGNLFSKVFKRNLDDSTEESSKKLELQKLLAQTITDTFALAGEAMNNYFDQERNRIAASNAAIKGRLDIEQEQLKNRAQSQAEQSSIDREFAQKKKDADREAFEENKKIQLAQAKINLGMQLSNIAVVASSPTPANLLTVGLFGQIMYGIQAALALIRYISNVNTIQSATFTGEKGLHADDWGTRGGVAKGRSHSRGGNKFMFKNRVFEDEVEEIEVIRTRNAPRGIKYQVSGTQQQIASGINVVGGGIDFAPGWDIKKLQSGGSLFNFDSPVFTLQAPSSPSTFLSRPDSDSSELRSMILQVARSVKEVGDKVVETTENVDTLAEQTNGRIDRLRVINVASETVKVNADKIKASNIGTL